MIPRSTSARALACLAYLPPVALVLLVSPEHRGIKLIRQHSLQSLILSVGSLLGAVLLGWGGTLLGALPGVGLFMLSATGLLISLWMLAMLGLAIVGAIAGYQGKYLRIGGISALVKNLERKLGPSRMGDPLQWEHDDSERSRRPRRHPD